MWHCGSPSPRTLGRRGPPGSRWFCRTRGGPPRIRHEPAVRPFCALRPQTHGVDDGWSAAGISERRATRPVGLGAPSLVCRLQSHLASPGPGCRLVSSSTHRDCRRSRAGHGSRARRPEPGCCPARVPRAGPPGRVPAHTPGVAPAAHHASQGSPGSRGAPFAASGPRRLLHRTKAAGSDGRKKLVAEREAVRPQHLKQHFLLREPRKRTCSFNPESTSRRPPAPRSGRPACTRFVQPPRAPRLPGQGPEHHRSAGIPESHSGAFIHPMCLDPGSPSVSDSTACR